MSGEEQQWLADAIQSNWIAPIGPMVDGFERDLGLIMNTPSVLAVHSGTSALHLGLRLLDVGPGDEVICSSLTYVASANPIRYLGAEPIFIDSEPSSWNMSPQALERALYDAKRRNRMPKAVVVVNLYGQSADMEPIKELCNHYGVPILEDAAESFGATYKGKASGTWGKFGVYSFNGNKIVTTSGGGALVAENEEALAKARFWASQARDQGAHYEHSELGYNYRLSNVLAAIGRGQLDVLEERIRARRKVFARYEIAFSHIEGISFMPERDYGRATRWLTALTLDPQRFQVHPSEMVAKLEEWNIEARPVWKPLHLQPLYNGCRYFAHEEHVSVSEYLFTHGICLPSGSSLTDTEQNRVIDAVESVLGCVVR
ncbi:DegT/DnrJ/EryC1/StrS family aminotransferase [Paenibacillus sp. 481]|uniref:DegT/DnrJ/EryC1/StrS family aminotransferase n=1 Tax=Paenibacillus sp. 481 TaxID=2835869 RepID=UPI0022B592C6|nr:aminotransferase class I/II-fold pyridoxal phosphate-dependent enzyme [Paenibacillus sp. 481]